jgi:hypothetical protein
MQDYDKFQPKQKKFPFISELHKRSYLLHELKQSVFVLLRKKLQSNFKILLQTCGLLKNHECIGFYGC